ncbi:MAG: RluA family pseudouridine synthase [Planctomycetia bacterium]
MMHAKEGFGPQDKDPRQEPCVLRSGGGVVAIAKPAGLATQAPPGLPSAEAWLRGQLSAGAYLGVPHRIDRAVSGVLLLAVTPRAARKLSRQFERREIGKTYLALLAGPGADAIDVGQEAVWRDSIAKIPNEPRARIAPHDDPGARAAETRVRFLGRVEPGVVSVRLEPLTGRMHQLRVQAAARGLPIVGDALYGAPAGPDGAGATDETDPRRRPIALHAWQIAYTDPDTGEIIRVEAPLPGGWPAIADAGGS